MRHTPPKVVKFTCLALEAVRALTDPAAIEELDQLHIGDDFMATRYVTAEMLITVLARGEVLK